MERGERKIRDMPTIDEKQRDTANWLVRQITTSQADRRALWNLSGAVGSGKTTVLRRVAEQLPTKNLIPIHISPPGREIDAAPIALLDIAQQLQNSGLLNGQMALLQDPRNRWEEKMTVVTDAVNSHPRDIVLLCDEPTHWYHFQQSRVDDTPDDCTARSRSGW